MTQIFIIENGRHGYYAEVVDCPNSDRELLVHTTENYPTRWEAVDAADAWEACHTCHHCGEYLCDGCGVPETQSDNVPF